MLKFICNHNLIYWPLRVLLSLMLIVFKIIMFVVNVLVLRAAFKIK